MNRYQVTINSPVGLLEITASDTAITSLKFVEERCEPSKILPAVVHQCVLQLREYFKGRREIFTVPIDMHGTDFQKTVWDQLCKIPMGKTSSYKDVASAIEKEAAVRAVGNANNKNPIAIIVPCHRVIGADGSLVGYAGGLWRKQWLLRHEKSVRVPVDISQFRSLKSA